MAARNKNWHPDKVRERIKASQLVNRLTDHVLGKAEMTATQVRAAEILLNRVVPTLQAVEVSFDGELATRDITNQPLSEQEWEQQYSTH